MIFVFGSNLKGIHGAGAALYAKEHHGAVMRQAEGLQGESYAIPTCEEPGLALTLEQVRDHVDFFLDFARKHHELSFQVTRIGCGYAGFTDAQIAPMFMTAPDNVWLPVKFALALYWLEH